MNTLFRLFFWALVASLGFVSSTARAADSTAPTIEHQRITEAALYETIRFRVEINDESAIFAPSLYYRYVGEIEYRSLEMKETARAYVARIEGGEVTGDLEYFLEAFDEHGNGPARDGSPKFPIRIAVGKLTPEIPPAVLVSPSPAKKKPAPTKRSVSTLLVPKQSPKRLVEPITPPATAVGSPLALHRRWWFWTSMVVALAAGGTAVAWALQPGVADTVRIRVIGPDPYGGLP